MAKISEKNDRYRSKETICRDLAIVLGSELSYGTKFAVVSEVTWVWSEFHGKHQGCKHWSEKAKNSGLPNKELIHEHIVPKKVLINTLLNMKNPTPDEIFKYLQDYCIGVVVTKDEDSQLNQAKLKSEMPKSWDGNDPWARYKVVGINVIHDKT